MHNVLLVQIVESIEDLHSDHPDDRLLNLAYIFQDVCQGACIHELERNVDFAFSLEGAVGLQHIVVVAVVERLQLNEDLLA